MGREGRDEEKFNGGGKMEERSEKEWEPLSFQTHINTLLKHHIFISRNASS